MNRRLNFLASGLAWLVLAGMLAAAGLVLDNTTESISPKLNLPSGLKLGNGALTANGDMAYDGTDFKMRRGGADHIPGFLGLNQTWTAAQTFSAMASLNGGATFGTYTPSLNGEVGYDGSNFLFREGGVNKIFAAQNAANTWAQLQSFGAGVRFSSSFTPLQNGELGWDGTNLLFREGDANRKFAATNAGNTFNVSQTFGDKIVLQAGAELQSFTPTLDGQMGWSGTAFLFREGGVNKTLSGLGFSGDLDGTANKVLSDGGSNMPVRTRDDQGLNVGNAAGTQTGTITASGAGELTVESALVVKRDAGLRVRNSAGTESERRRGLSGTTSDGVETEISIDGSGTVFLTIASGATHAFCLHVAARCTTGADAGKSALYRIEVVARNNGGTTALEGSQFKTIVAEGAAGWDANCYADDANDRLAVKVTGTAANTLKWSCAVQETVITD